MKKMLLMLTAVMAALHISAAQVDLVTAQAKAKQFVLEQVANGKMRAAANVNPKLVLTEMGKTHADKAAYYIFNTDDRFVIVAGDDRAEEILAIGDRPLDVNRIPINMQSLLNTYREQMDYLFSNPNIHVDKPFKANVMINAETVAPLLTALWDQDAPYYNQCTIGGYQCLTGCPATSAAMVFYYWKYPTDPTPEVPGYRSKVNYSYWGSTNVNVPALPSVTFDWDNMLDRYRGVNYSTEEGNAVATLMRYVGQAERMEYGTYAAGGSGVDADSVENIANAFLFYGYDETTVRFVKKTSSYYGGQTLYSDAEWAAMIQEELTEQRPIVYCAISNEGGHAFNVDGYDAESNKYHVNYGWSGDGNGDFALNAFSDGSSTFNQYQQMVIGIQPGYQGPAVQATSRNISMACYTGETATATFNVKGRDLTGDVTLTLEDENGVFSADVTSVALADTQEDGKEVTVTFAPQVCGEYTAIITLTSDEAKEAVVKLKGTATLRKANPVALEPTQIETNSFRAAWTDDTPEGNVASYTLVVHQDGFEVAEDVAAADFSTLNSTGEFNDFDLYCDPLGWTGSNVYADKGGVRLGYSSSEPLGSITTPQLDFSRSGGKLTITFKAKVYGGGSGESSLLIKTGEHSVKQELKSSNKTYTVVLDCDEFDNETITFSSSGKRVYLTSISVTTTDVTTAPRSSMAPQEQGDAMSRTITGITDKFYTVTGLTAGASYHYKVKALYIDETESRWTASTQVVLLPGEFVLGDVDGNGTIDVSDVNILINIMLGKDDIANYGARADINGDGKIDVTDVNMVINMMLGK